MASNGILLDIVIPFWYAYFSFKVNKGFTMDDPDEWISKYDERYHISKYLIGGSQCVSAVFMIIAIHKIAKSVRQDGNLSEDLNQNMLILHQVTFTLYLLATITYYIIYGT